MATIKFIHRYRGWKDANPHGKDTPGGHQAGDVVDCSPKRAAWFIEKELAVSAAGKKKKKVEVTSVEPKAERAVIVPNPEKRGPGRPPKVKEQEDVNVL